MLGTWTARARLAVVAGLLAGWMGIAPAARADGRDVLKVIPDSATGFVVINSVRGSADAARAFADKVAPGALPPGDLLDQVLDGTPLKDQFDAANGAAIGITDPTLGEQGVFVVVPVKDPKKVLEDLKAAPVEGAADVYSAELMGAPAFLAAKGSFLVASPAKDTISAVLSAKASAADSFGASQTALLAKSTLWLHGNAAPVQPLIAAFLQALAEGEGVEGAGSLVKDVTSLLADLKSGDLVVTLDAAGPRLTGFLQSAPGGLAGKLIAAGRKVQPTGSLLTGLPAVGQPVLVVGAVSGFDPDVYAVSEKLTRSIYDLPDMATEVNKEAVAKVLAIHKQIAQAVTAQAAVVTALPAGADGVLGLAAVVRHASSGPAALKPAEAAENLRAAYEALVADADTLELVKAAKVTANAGQVAGKPCHTVTADFMMLVPKSEQEDVATALKKILGTDGLTARLIEVEPGVLVVTLGGGPAFAEAAVKAALAKEAPLAKVPAIAAAAAQLQADRSVELYFCLDNLVVLVKALAGAVGEPVPPVSVKPLSSAAAISFGTVGADTLRMDLFVPTDLITEGAALADGLGGGGGAPPEGTTPDAAPAGDAPAPAGGM